MKKVTVMKLAIFFTSILLFTTYDAENNAFAGKDSEGWTSLRGDIYINMNSIASTYGSTVSLWVKVVPDENSDVLMRAREQLMDKGRDDKALTYSYSGLLTEIDCSKNIHRELITILYDANKNILHSVNNSKASWTTISTGSSFNLVQRAVCEKSLPVVSHQYEDVRSGC